MPTKPRESIYLVRLGTDTHILRVEELTQTGGSRDGRYRLRIPTNKDGEGKTITTSSELETALCGAEFLLGRAKRRDNPLNAEYSGILPVH